MSVGILRRSLASKLPQYTSPCTPRIPRFHRTFTPQSFRRQYAIGQVNPTPALDTLIASRTINHQALPIYNIIADIESYPKFLPYVLSANVSQWSQPDGEHKRKWPQLAELTIGWGEIREKFASRVVCIPPSGTNRGSADPGFVEAISGKSDSAIKPEDAPHHDHNKELRTGKEADWSLTSMPGGAPLELLRTRWTIRPFPYKPAPPHGSHPAEVSVQPTPEPLQKTDVSVEIEYKFRNMVYEAMSKAVAPKLAEVMIAAFEKRIDSELGGGHDLDLM